MARNNRFLALRIEEEEDAVLPSPIPPATPSSSVDTVLETSDAPEDNDEEEEEHEVHEEFEEVNIAEHDAADGDGEEQEEVKGDGFDGMRPAVHKSVSTLHASVPRVHSPTLLRKESIITQRFQNNTNTLDTKQRPSIVLTAMHRIAMVCPKSNNTDRSRRTDTHAQTQTQTQKHTHTHTNTHRHTQTNAQTQQSRVRMYVSKTKQPVCPHSHMLLYPRMQTVHGCATGS